MAVVMLCMTLPTLTLELEVKRGELHVVTGPTAAGKSLLVAGILGQAGSAAGSISRAGTTAYCSQEVGRQ